MKQIYYNTTTAFMNKTNQILTDHKITDMLKIHT